MGSDDWNNLTEQKSASKLVKSTKFVSIHNLANNSLVLDGFEFFLLGSQLLCGHQTVGCLNGSGGESCNIFIFSDGQIPTEFAKLQLQLLTIKWILLEFLQVFALFFGLGHIGILGQLISILFAIVWFTLCCYTENFVPFFEGRVEIGFGLERFEFEEWSKHELPTYINFVILIKTLTDKVENLIAWIHQISEGKKDTSPRILASSDPNQVNTINSIPIINRLQILILWHYIHHLILLIFCSSSCDLRNTNSFMPTYRIVGEYLLYSLYTDSLNRVLFSLGVRGLDIQGLVFFLHITELSVQQPASIRSLANLLSLSLSFYCSTGFRAFWLAIMASDLSSKFYQKFCSKKPEQ